MIGTAAGQASAHLMLFCRHFPVKAPCLFANASIAIICLLNTPNAQPQTSRKDRSCKAVTAMAFSARFTDHIFIKYRR
jgi:hypothetical protein